LGLVAPARAIAKRGYYPCLKEGVSMLNSKRRAVIMSGISIALVFVSETWIRTSACRTSAIQTTSAVKPALRNLTQLINALKTRGKKVRRKGRVEQPFLTVKGQIITIDGEDVQVFEYRTARAAEVDAQNVSGAGSTSIAMWIAPPHFFKSGRLIVLYVGEAPSVLKALADTLGPQFGGK
jgi:hypothetical protein